MTCKYTLLLLVITGWSFVNGQALYQNISLNYGAHSVGYDHVVKTDRTRPYDRTMDYANTLTFRPMPISSWYPLASADSLETVSISDYTRVLKEEEEWESLPDAYFFSWFYYPETPAGKANLGRLTHAFRGGEVREGKHPVVIYAPSYQASSAENFILCEYLASQGYLVLATPSRGVDQRQMGKGTTAEAEAQLHDLNFLVGHASTLPNADLDRLYTIGFSFGGFPSVLLAMRNRYVDGVISLDGTMQYHPEVLTASKFYQPDGLRVPFVHFSQQEIPEAVLLEDGIDPDFGKPFVFFDSLRQAPAYHFRAKHLTHGNFSAMGVLFQPRDLRQEPPEPRITSGYVALCETVKSTLAAMDAYRALSAEWDHAAYTESCPESEMILLARKTPNTKRYTIRDFAAAMRNADFQQLKDVYLAVQQGHPEFQVAEGDLNTIGLQLAFAEETREAGLRVFHFAVSLFPESGNLYDSLAEAYFMAGRLKAAEASFERSLELSPGNGNAVLRLRELRR
jgi:hypothetical protein